MVTGAQAVDALLAFDVALHRNASPTTPERILAMKAALEAHEASLLAAGRKVVPRRAAPEQIKYACECTKQTGSAGALLVERIYNFMVEAAP